MGGWAIAVHGGAGVDPYRRQEEAKILHTICLNIGIVGLRSNLPAIDVVERVVRELETHPLFNSGRGSGTVDMEASIMDGPSRRCGAVSGVTSVKNPVSLARLVMENSPHSHLAFSGAEEFARQQGVEMVENDYFPFEENVGMLNLFDYPIPNRSRGTGAATTDSPLQMDGLPIGSYAPETVGCVAVDSQGRCAAATSTGGLMNKMTGGIGCTPTIGAGTYACDFCAVSCTGKDEEIIRGALAREVAAVMEYGGLNLPQAMDFVIREKQDQEFAGLIAVSKNGEVACGYNRKESFRGRWNGAWATQDW